MAVQCTDNSTECLLRALIEATETQQDPWSFPSFLVTLVIGAIATAFSLATVFQALLAAGPDTGTMPQGFGAIVQG